MAKKKGVFIERNKLRELILSVGSKKWDDFEASELAVVGNSHRCNIVADEKKAMLDFYFNNNGTTTITPTGTNKEISTAIKVLLEDSCSYSNNIVAKTHSIKNLPQEWTDKLIEYLYSLEGTTVEKRDDGSYISYIFKSKVGDKLTLNCYKTGTLTLQGKPAYLYSEAISFLSYCTSVSLDDIVDTVNTFHNIDIKATDVKSEMQLLLPNSYGNIDNMVLKLLSPSISLRQVNIDMEDYSCYAFPALRALEGYIKYIFSLKDINIGHNFYGIFNDKKITPDISAKIGDNTYIEELERLYDYFSQNRHVIFHTEQVLIGTTILEDKKEADEIVNNVLYLIETSYNKISEL